MPRYAFPIPSSTRRRGVATARVPPVLLRRERVARWRGDAGASATETVIVTPLLLALLLLIVQFALVEHAQHIAQTAASRALAATRAQGGSAAVGRQRAGKMLAVLGHGVLLDPTVAVQRGPRTATAVVRGRVETVVPGLRLHVSARAAGAVDRWTSPTGAQR